MANFPTISYAQPTTYNPAPDPSGFVASATQAYNAKKIQPGGLGSALQAGGGGNQGQAESPVVHFGNLLHGLAGLFRHITGGGGGDQ